jgi:hypothetical protein
MKQKHVMELAHYARQGDFELTDEGLLVHKSARIFGRYTTSVNGEDEHVDYNLLPTEGIAYLLNTGLAGNAQIANWYVAVYSGAVSPAASWTAANFSANATEITSNTEGYSNPTRPQWTPGAVAGGVIGNLASRATFNIVCSTTITISGAAVLSSNTKGGTTGTLISATRYASARVVNNGDTFAVGYEIGLTDS